MFGGGWCRKFGGLGVCNDIFHIIWDAGFGYKSYFEASLIFKSYCRIIASGSVFFCESDLSILTDPNQSCEWFEWWMFLANLRWFVKSSLPKCGKVVPSTPGQKAYELNHKRSHQNVWIFSRSSDCPAFRVFGGLFTSFPTKPSGLFSYWVWENRFCNGPIFGPQTFPWTYMFWLQKSEKSERILENLRKLVFQA